MRRTVLALVGAASLAVAALSSPAAQASPSPELASHAAHPLGMIHPAHGGGGGPLRSTTSNLLDHGGPVMAVNTVYAIYYAPTTPAGTYDIPASYESLINQYFQDVQADTGTTSNVYYSDLQYLRGGSNTSTFGGWTVDTTGLPANGCKDRYTSVCLSDSQIQDIVTRNLGKGGLPSSPTLSDEFFVFTAKGIGSCAGRSCAFSQYCAYHSWTGTNGTTLYANMPYADTVPAACDAGQHPNNNDADATINVTSHEHNETITDPNGNAWYDSSGYENGDKCAWNFGAVTGTSGAEWNQSINGHHYFLQQEWSNAHNNNAGACVLQGT